MCYEFGMRQKSVFAVNQTCASFKKSDLLRETRQLQKLPTQRARHLEGGAEGTQADRGSEQVCRKRDDGAENAPEIDWSAT